MTSKPTTSQASPVSQPECNLHRDSADSWGSIPRHTSSALSIPPAFHRSPATRGRCSGASLKLKQREKQTLSRTRILGAQPGPECSGRRRPGLPHLELPVAPLAPFLAPAPTSPSPGWENSCYSGAGDAARLNPRLSEPCCGLVPGALLGALKDLWVQPALRTVPSPRAPLCP